MSLLWLGSLDSDLRLVVLSWLRSMAAMENTAGQTLVKCTDTEDGKYSEITQRLKQRKDSGRVNTLAALECSYDEV